jgi:hypothetical protein
MAQSTTSVGPKGRVYGNDRQEFVAAAQAKLSAGRSILRTSGMGPEKPVGSYPLTLLPKRLRVLAN